MFGERLKKARKKSGMTQMELAQKLNLTDATLNRYEKGHRKPDPETLSKIAEILHVSVDWLLGRTDNPEPFPNFEELLKKMGGWPAGEMVPIPVLSVIRCGSSIYAEQNILGYEMVSADVIRGEEYFYLKVTGDSMSGVGMIPGSFVLVKRQDFVNDGEIAVVIADSNEATIKRVRFVNGQVMLIPANPAYEPKLYHEKEVKIIGKVVQTMIKYD